MIDHFSQDELATVTSQVMNARQDPLLRILLYLETTGMYSLGISGQFSNILQPLFAVVGSKDEGQICTARIHCLQSLARMVCLAGMGWIVAMMYMEEQSILLKDLQLDVSPSLLLSLAFAERCFPLFQQRKQIFQLEEVELYDLMKNVTRFLIAQGMYEAAVTLLDGLTDMLSCKGPQESTGSRLRFTLMTEDGEVAAKVTASGIAEKAVDMQSSPYKYSEDSGMVGNTVNHTILMDELVDLIKCCCLLRDRGRAQKYLHRYKCYYKKFKPELDDFQLASGPLTYRYYAVLDFLDTETDEELWARFPYISRRLRQHPR